MRHSDVMVTSRCQAKFQTPRCPVLKAVAASLRCWKNRVLFNAGMPGAERSKQQLARACAVQRQVNRLRVCVNSAIWPLQVSTPATTLRTASTAPRGSGACTTTKTSSRLRRRHETPAVFTFCFTNGARSSPMARYDACGRVRGSRNLTETSKALLIFSSSWLAYQTLQYVLCTFSSESVKHYTRLRQKTASLVRGFAAKPPSPRGVIRRNLFRASRVASFQIVVVWWAFAGVPNLFGSVAVVNWWRHSASAWDRTFAFRLRAARPSGGFFSRILLSANRRLAEQVRAAVCPR